MGLMGFLARYRAAPLRAHERDLRAFLRWAADRQLQPLKASRPHLELDLRWMQQQGYARTTISRRFSTVAGVYRYTVLDGHLATYPTLAITRPRAPWEAQRRTRCTRWSTRRCSPPLGMTGRTRTRSWRCSA